MKMLTNENYHDEILKMISNEDSLDIAVAYWGEKAIDLFKEYPGKKIRIICNLESGGCNPNVIEKLRKFPNIELRNHAKLHAKLLIQETLMIIGSANLSANGLAFEDSELKGWEEAGILVNGNDAEIAEAREWFECIWASSNPNIDSLLEVAKKNWRYRRKHRLPDRSEKSLFEAARKNPADFNDRDPIFFVIYSKPLSKKAEAKRQEIETEHPN